MKPIPGAPVLRASGLRKEYGRGAGLVRAVDGVDLEVAAGQTVAVMGPSGCGKSTLLHLPGGLDRPTGGGIELAGRRLDQLSEKELARLRREAVGFVFQAFHLMDELTAVENVELPALLAGRSPRAARRRAAALLDRVGLADRAGFMPAALSGGQRQRVAIARALVSEPAGGWRRPPGGSGCSRRSAVRPPWSRPCSWPRTWPWRWPPPRSGWPQGGWPPRCSPIPVPR
jgi:putative ABC transport system ATP-binding protein